MRVLKYLRFLIKNNINILNGSSEEVVFSIDGDEETVEIGGEVKASGFEVSLVEYSKTDSLISGTFVIGSKKSFFI